MTWRVHLSNRPLQRVDFLRSSLLAAWPSAHQVYCFDVATGAQMGERTLHPPERDSGERWQHFVAANTAIKGLYLPFARAGSTSIYISEDGRMRLYHEGGAALALDIDGREVPLDSADAGEFLALDMDRFLGLIGALDEAGRLHLYQQHIRVGAFDLDLRPRPDLRPSVAIAHGGSAIYVTDGRRILLVDVGGQIRRSLEPHYEVGRMACSPNGRLLVTGDMDTNVIRIYNGADLTPTHQRHAVDLLADADQLQLLADLPPSTVALADLAIANNGAVAFALGGTVCISQMARMNALPRPQRLF